MALYTILSKPQIGELLKRFPNLPHESFKTKGIALGTVNTYYRITFKFGAVYYLKIDEVADEARLVREVGATLAKLDALLSSVQALLGDRTNAELWLPFQTHYDALTTEQRAAIETEVDVAGVQESFAHGLDRLRSSDARPRLEELHAALTDPKRLDRILIGSMHGYAARQLSQVGVTGLGGRVRLDPQAMLAIFNAYSLSADPAPPVRTRDIKDGVAMLTSDLLSEIPPDRRAELEAALGGAELAEITGAAAAVLTDAIRRELNDILLQAMLSAESLDELSVGRGLRPGELNAGAIRRSFAHPDDRRDGGGSECEGAA